MKCFKAFLFFFLFSSSHATEFSLINTYLFELALGKENIPFCPFSLLAGQTITLCEKELSFHTKAKSIINRIGEEKDHQSQISLPAIASFLAQVILDKPTPLQELYTATQLTHHAIQQGGSNLLQLEEAANQTILAVAAALAPFIKEEKKKRIMGWFLLLGGITIGLVASTKLYQYLSNLQEEIIFLQQRLTALEDFSIKQFAESEANHAAHIQALRQKIAQQQHALHALERQSQSRRLEEVVPAPPARRRSFLASLLEIGQLRRGLHHVHDTFNSIDDVLTQLPLHMPAAQGTR